MTWEIKRYKSDCKEEWDAFVEASRNATFLFKREYMEYHSSRFADCSLMAYRKGKLAAVIPANVSDGILYSHQGLTYGGWLLPARGLDTREIREMWRCWLKYCVEEEIREIDYKPVPYIYTSMPSQEDLYMLFLSGASLISTNISTTIDLGNNPGFDKLQKRHLKKAVPDFYGHIITADTPEFVNRFYSLLSSCLEERHSVSPVHSGEELQLLMSRFPDNIRIWGAYSDSAEGMLAGVCVYEAGPCVHCQYIATSEQGRSMNILSPLFKEMIDYYASQGFRFFDFGISNEEGGRYLNAGLNRQKTSYGGSGVVYQRYGINVSSALQSVL